LHRFFDDSKRSVANSQFSQHKKPKLKL
jgi:hypothetical protein